MYNNQFIYIDDFTGLEYIEYQDYIDHPEYFDDINKEDIIQYILNANILQDLSQIKDYLNLLAGWLHHLEYPNIESMNTHEEITIIKDKILEPFLIISFEYLECKSHKGIWKYIDKTLEDLFNYTFEDSIPGMTLEKLVSDEYYNKIFNMEGKLIRNE